MTQYPDVLLPVSDIATDELGPVTDDGSFRGGQCLACQAFSFPCGYICPTCNSTDIVPRDIPGVGSLYSHTTVSVSATFPTPYSVGYVDLECGLRVLGQLLDAPDALACDISVRTIKTAASPTGWGFEIQQEGVAR